MGVVFQEPSFIPFFTPYLLIASIMYCEQVGVKRQEGGVRGEIQYL